MQYTSREVYEYISQQTNDPIVEWKKCTISGQEFPIYQSDMEFYDKISPSFAGKKFAIPTPALCPEERQRRRLSFRNERKLYRRKCDATGESIISIYSPDKPYKVYNQSFWWSDKRDPVEYGFDFDFGKSFAENFDILMKNVPRSNFYGNGNENSDYTNHCNNSKNCYMCADLVSSQSCLYSTTSIDSEETVDCYLATNSKYVYETSCSSSIYSSQYIFNSENCTYSSFLVNCKNCDYCIGCTNLINKKYYIFNKKYTKEEYLKIKNELSNAQLMGKWNNIVKSSININCTIANSEKCYGNGIQDSNTSILNFLLYSSNGVKYSHVSGWFNDSYDCFESGLNSSLLYECHAVMGSYNSHFISISYNNNNSYYLDNCYDNNSLFGCIGLRNKQYCIFNKQYTESEYNELVAKIISHMKSTGEWGEFFDPSLSPFGYNETVANEYYPVQVIANEMKQSIVDYHVSDAPRNDYGIDLAKFGYKWSDYSSDPKVPDGVKTYCKTNYDDITWNELVNDNNIVKYIIICEVSGRPFMIQKMELEFYRKHSLGIPSKHPDVRHEERMRLRPGRTLYLRNCDCCGDEMLSVYDKDYESKVYCEKCYQKEVYG